MKRDWLTLAFGLGLVAVVVGLSFRQNLPRRAAEQNALPKSEAAVAALPLANPTQPPAPLGAPVAAAPTPGPVRATDVAAVSARTKPRVIPASRNSEPVVAAATPEEATIVLQVQSDVAGASVFLDRQFVGTTPLNLRGLTKGSKQLNVTATGHEGYSSTIDLTDGTNRVNVEFMKVRLNATIPVVHRHAMGSCQGMLAASAKGLSYETTDKDDAFTMTLPDIDAFDVDYLKKNLRVRSRAGRTWNFTNNNSDALFVFHRDVSKAREKLTTR